MIDEAGGPVNLMYYSYCDNLHHPPSDWDDLVNGLLYIDYKCIVEKQQMEDSRRRR